MTIMLALIDRFSLVCCSYIILALIERFSLMCCSYMTHAVTGHTEDLASDRGLAVVRKRRVSAGTQKSDSPEIEPIYNVYYTACYKISYNLYTSDMA